MRNIISDDPLIASPFKAEKAQLEAELERLAVLLDRPQKEQDVEAIVASLDALERISRGHTQALHQERLNQHMAGHSRSPQPVQNQKHHVELSQTILHISTLITGVRLQILGKRIPLTLPLSADHPVASDTYLSDDIFSTLHKLLSPIPQQDRGRDKGQYADIPLLQSKFLRLIGATYRIALTQRRPFPLRFLDVGCGTGLKVLSAAKLFHQSDGLEYDTGYAELARQLCLTAGLTCSNIIVGDALEYTGYDQYDIIYFYKPISDRDMLIALEQRIAKLARPKTILITPYDDFTTRAEDLGCARVAEHIYVTQANATEGETLAADATLTGLTTHAMFHPEPSDEMWRGVINASLRNGFNPFSEGEGERERE